ncbi:acetyl-CoA carboxylase biotin carboxyl carrier protein [Pseudomonas sp. HK3]
MIKDPAATMIWDHDNDVLQDALSFYDSLETQLAEHGHEDLDYIELSEIINGPAPEGFHGDIWHHVQAAHLGYQAGVEIFTLLPYIANETNFYALDVNEDLSIYIPDALFDETLQKNMMKVLVPPPTAKGDEILAASGGMFYSCEAPGMPAFIQEGDHFEAGQPLYIVEVMKMFNKVNAPFAGTIEKVLINEDGTIIKKGQPLFKIVADEKVVIETPDEIQARRREQTDVFLITI